MFRIVLALSAGLVLAAATPPVHAEEPAPVLREVIVEGNTKTEREVIDRIIAMEPGDRFTLTEFDGVWDRLEDCGYFAFVDLSTEEDDTGGVTLLVTVEEEKTTRWTPYIRYDRRHKYLLGAGLTDKNLGGRGEVLSLLAVVYRIQRAQATWEKPWLFGADRLSLRLDALWEQGGFVYRPFDYGQWWTLADLRQYVAGPVYVEAGGGYQSFRQKDDYAWDEGWDTGQGGVATYPETTRDTWLVRGRIGVDTRDNPYYPARGVFAEYGLTHRFGGDIDGQTTNEVDLRAFVPLPGAPILAVRGYGKVHDRVTATEYVLRWGGPETVRGAPYAGREGDLAYLASAELRWPLFMMPVAVTGEQVGLGLHAFTDVGDAFYDDQSTTNPRALLSFGAGVHVNLLTWQLRFEAAKERDHDWTFEFMDVFNF